MSNGRPVKEATSLPYASTVTVTVTDSMQIQLFGRGAHGSMPQASIDPVVMAAATVMRPQTIVSREVARAGPQLGHSPLMRLPWRAYALPER